MYVCMYVMCIMYVMYACVTDFMVVNLAITQLVNERNNGIMSNSGFIVLCKNEFWLYL